MEIIEQQDLYVGGDGSYKRYRIPALVTSNTGTILAFCEARKFSGHDSDQIDLLLRRSHDGGKTFEEVRIITTEKDWTCGNPAPVVDRQNGIIWMAFCKNPKSGNQEMICKGKACRTVWITSSKDDGETWLEPKEITPDVKRPEWSWYATGPCHGIQTSSGRLIIPCDHTVFKDYSRQDPTYSHIIYSDDRGKTWQIGGTVDEDTDESTVLETVNGWLYFNCRNRYALSDGGNYRSAAWSKDEGKTFSPLIRDEALPEPGCQASVFRFTDEKNHDRNRVLFSNPGVRSGGYLGRHHLTIRLSYDECKTWPIGRVLHESGSAYSDLCISTNMNICCLYERGSDDWPYEKITFARFNLEWLTEDKDRLTG